MTKREYLKQTAATRAERLRWWQEARFGMFVHESRRRKPRRLRRGGRRQVSPPWGGET
jgi:hypothetical protein